MTVYRTNDTDLKKVADAIRAKGGTSADLTYPNGFVTAIQNIQTGTDTTDATLDSNTEMLSGYTAYSNGVKYTGSIPTKTSSDLTASTLTVTVPSGYYASNATKTLTDSNLVAGNIKNGTTIFGVTGTYSGGGGGGKNVQGYMGQDYSHTGSLVATDVSLKVAKTGTYKVSWSGFRNTTSGTSQSQLYINGSAYGSAQGTFTSSYGQNVVLSGVSLNEDDVITVYARARNTTYYMYVSNLIIEEQ